MNILNTDKKYNVLYVDDEATSLRVFKNTFQREFNVFVASSGIEALEILEIEVIHLIISDQRMDKMTGIEFLEKAKKIVPRVKLILLTGYTDIGTLSEAINYVQIWRFMTKPWDVHMMRNMIIDAIDIYMLENELNNANDLLKLAINVSKTGVVKYDLNSQDLYLSEETHDILGYKPSVSRKKMHILLSKIYKVDREHVIDSFLKFIKKNDQNNIFSLDFRIKKHDNYVIWIHAEGRIASNNFIIVIKDITDFKSMEQRHLALVLDTEEKERSRIAKDLHDSVGQKLTTSLLFFDSLRKDLVTQNEHILERYTKALNVLRETMSELRDVSHNLIPKTISDYGLAPTIESMINSFNKMNETIVFDFYHNIEGFRLTKNIELGLYRIIQESISNSLKHANATQISIQVIQSNDSVILSVEDDGVGFDKNILNDEISMGIQNMVGRAKALSGVFEIDTSRSNGTCVTVIVPFKK